MSVTHNHAGPPPSAWNWTGQGQAALSGYFGLLPELAAGAALLARNDLRSARLGVGSGESQVGVNRRETAPDGRSVTGANPQGFADPQVFVLRIDDLDSRPIAAVVGYTMHPTTLGPTNRLISPDWPGHMKRTVEAITGTTCLFVQGAAGNVGPGPRGFTDDLNVVRTIGAQVGCEAARVWLGIDVPAVQRRHDSVLESGAPLSTWRAEPIDEPAPVVRFARHEVALPVIEHPPVAEALARVETAQRRLNQLKAAGAPDDEIAATTFVVKRANMAHWRAETYGGRETVILPIYLLQIGPAVFAAIEGEPFAEIGAEIKRRSPFPHTWFGGYTNGWAAYIPVAEAYPHAGYEVDTSPFAPEAAAILVNSVVEALRRLAAT